MYKPFFFLSSIIVTLALESKDVEATALSASYSVYMLSAI